MRSMEAALNELAVALVRGLTRAVDGAPRPDATSQDLQQEAAPADSAAPAPEALETVIGGYCLQCGARNSLLHNGAPRKLTGSITVNGKFIMCDRCESCARQPGACDKCPRCGRGSTYNPIRTVYSCNGKLESALVCTDCTGSARERLTQGELKFASETDSVASFREALRKSEGAGFYSVGVIGGQLSAAGAVPQAN